MGDCKCTPIHPITRRPLSLALCCKEWVYWAGIIMGYRVHVVSVRFNTDVGLVI